MSPAGIIVTFTFGPFGVRAKAVPGADEPRSPTLMMPLARRPRLRVECTIVTGY